MPVIRKTGRPLAPQTIRTPGGDAHARPACPHRPPCPGCPRFAERGIAPAARAALEELARIHDLPEVPVLEGQGFGFRMRARLAIRGRVGSPKVGLFETDSHRVVHIPNCSVHHPLINRVASVVRRALVETDMTCYSDRAHLGVARYLQVVVERSSQTAQVVLVANCSTPQPVAACLDLIRDRLGKDLHSLWFNGNCTQSNVILGPQWHHWVGPESVVERFGGAAVHYPPGAFGQSNLDLAERLIAYVRAQIPPGARAAEFYAGVGAIGLSVLNQVSEIRFNEVSPASLDGLASGIEQLSDTERRKVSVVAGAAGDSTSAMAGAQIVIADPPRKGLDAELVACLRDSPPERFIYVSCGLASFVENVGHLTAKGTLRLRSLCAFNLIPFTAHAETVACFERC
jgi:tRNA/tmRNA/rRNA uracil-C5-methylase (TrmA/RlmC/RlmD family)